MTKYVTFIDKMITRGHASPVPQNQLATSPGKVWYLPHFPVLNPKKPDIRVVYDASSEFRGVSLNNCFYQDLTK